MEFDLRKHVANRSGLHQQFTVSHCGGAGPLEPEALRECPLVARRRFSHQRKPNETTAEPSQSLSENPTRSAIDISAEMLLEGLFELRIRLLFSTSMVRAVAGLLAGREAATAIARGANLMLWLG
jgi:hypothetical protein